MKQIIILNLFTLFLTMNIYSQVGINTKPDPSTILHIEAEREGVLFPRVKLESADKLSPLPNDTPENTIVFNTERTGSGINRLLPGYYSWHNNNWTTPLVRASKKAARYFPNVSNSSFNFQSTSAGRQKNIELFQTLDFNDEPTLFQAVNNTSMKINKPGTYLVTTNLGLKNTKKNRTNTEIYIAYFLDNKIASSKVTMRVNQNRDVSVNRNAFTSSFNSYVVVKKVGQVLSMAAITNFYDKDDSVYFDSDNVSSVTIVRVSDSY